MATLDAKQCSALPKDGLVIKGISPSLQCSQVVEDLRLLKQVGTLANNLEIAARKLNLREELITGEDSPLSNARVHLARISQIRNAEAEQLAVLTREAPGKSHVDTSDRTVLESTTASTEAQNNAVNVHFSEAVVDLYVLAKTLRENAKTKGEPLGDTVKLSAEAVELMKPYAKNGSRSVP